MADQARTVALIAARLQKDEVLIVVLPEYADQRGLDDIRATIRELGVGNRVCVCTPDVRLAIANATDVEAVIAQFDSPTSNEMTEDDGA